MCKSLPHFVFDNRAVSADDSTEKVTIVFSQKILPSFARPPLVHAAAVVNVPPKPELEVQAKLE
jgi:hypothetical protein